MADHTKNMTEGKPLSLILEFALPLLWGLIFQQVYNVVDTMIVGRFLGVEALAAVGSTGSLMFLTLGLCTGVCSGFALPVAQRFGAKDVKELKKFTGNSWILAGLMTILMTVVTVTFCRGILLVMNTPENIMDMAYQYVVVIFAGIPCTVLYNHCSGLLRAVGDSKHPLYFLIFSSILNIALDLLFILQFHMGVAGAALATILAQGVSGVWSLIFLLKKVPVLVPAREDLRPESACIRTLLVMGLPMGFQYSITAIGSVILQTAINGLGSDAVAAVAAASKIDMFAQCPFQALGNAMATYAGQNVGAGKYQRVKSGMAVSCIMGSIYSLAALLCFRLFSKYLFLLFVSSSNTEVISMACQCILIYGLFFIPLTFVNIIRYTIQGMGFSALAIISGVMEMIARSAVGIFIVPVFGFLGACMAGPSAWILADAFLIPAFFWCLKKCSEGNGEAGPSGPDSLN